MLVCMFATDSEMAGPLLIKFSVDFFIISLFLSTAKGIWQGISGQLVGD